MTAVHPKFLLGAARRLMSLWLPTGRRRSRQAVGVAPLRRCAVFSWAGRDCDICATSGPFHPQSV